jgi:hypothetical protein
MNNKKPSREVLRYLRELLADLDEDRELIAAMPIKEVRAKLRELGVDTTQVHQRALRLVKSFLENTAARQATKTNLDPVDADHVAGYEEQANGFLDRTRGQVESCLLELEVAVISLSNWLTGHGPQVSPVFGGVKQDKMLGTEETPQAISSVAVIPLANIDEKRQLEKVPWIGAKVRIAQAPDPYNPVAVMYAASVDVVRNAKNQEGALRISLVAKVDKMQRKTIAAVELTARERTKMFSVVGGEPMHLALGDLEARIEVLERIQP